MKTFIALFLLLASSVSLACTNESMLHRSWFSVTSESFYYTFTAENIGELDFDSIPAGATKITVGDYTYSIVEDIDALPDKFMSEDRSFVISTFRRDGMDYKNNGAAVRVDFFDPESELDVRAYVTFKKNPESCYWVGVSQVVTSY